MQLKKLESAITRTERAGINENWEKIERGFSQTASDLNAAHDKADSAKRAAENAVNTANDIDGKATEALNKSNQAVSTSNTAKNTANQAKTSADAAVKQISEAIKESGDTNSEVVMSRTDTNDGETYNSLFERLDKQRWRLTKQAADTNDDAFYGGVLYNRDIKPSLVIIDDDAYPQVHALLKPICEEFNIPITTAVVTSRVNNSNSSMTLKQLHECEKAGMEIVSHTPRHLRMAELTDEEIEYECRESKRWLHEHGFLTNVIVYPFGSFDERVRKITSKYYRGGFLVDSGRGGVLQPPLSHYAMRRFNYNSDDGTNRIQEVKDKITEAKNTNGLLVVMMHCFYDGFDANGVREFVQHAINEGVEIITAKKAIERFGNVIDTPELQIDATGKVTKFPQTPQSYRILTGLTAENSADDFPSNTVSELTLSGTNLNGSPSGVSGTMRVHKYSSSVGAWREWINIGTLNKFKSRWAGGTWSDWIADSQRTTITSRDRTFDFGEIPAHSCVKRSLSSASTYTDTNALFTRLSQILPDGILASQLSIDLANNRAYYTLCNVTANPINVGSVTFKEFEISTSG